METGEVMYEKVYMSPRPPPKIPLRHDWTRELGSEHAQRPEKSCANPLLELTRESRKMEEKRPVSRKSM